MTEGPRVFRSHRAQYALIRFLNPQRLLTAKISSVMSRHGFILSRLRKHRLKSIGPILLSHALKLY